MRPVPTLVKHYPLAIGLAILLLPYLYSLLLFPFTIRNYLTKPRTTSKVASSVVKTTLITSTSTTAGYNFWRGFRTASSESNTSSTLPTSKKTTGKTTSTKDKSTKSSAIKQKTVTKSVTATKSVTETIKFTLEKPVETVEKEGTVVIEEISIMGWHQVHYLLILN
jgi:hypothetical protein